MIAAAFRPTKRLTNCFSAFHCTTDDAIDCSPSSAQQCVDGMHSQV